MSCVREWEYWHHAGWGRKRGLMGEGGKERGRVGGDRSSEKVEKEVLLRGSEEGTRRER